MHVQATSSMRDQTLQAIDHNAVITANFLEEFASDKKKRDCLIAFAECQKIVEWIRTVTEGLLYQKQQYYDTRQYYSLFPYYRCE